MSGPLQAPGGGVNAARVMPAKDTQQARPLSPRGVPAPPPSSNAREPQRPVDDNHALRIGWVAGALMRSVEVEPLTGIKTRGVEIVDDDEGNHLDTIRLYAPSGTFLVTVTRESYS